MKKIVTSLGLALLFSSGAYATDITTLLNALKKRPEHRLDSLAVEKSALGEQALADKLLPSVDMHLGYEIYNSPNGMVPVPPNELIHMVQNNPAVPQPFSKGIMREGASLTWPIFIKSILTLKEKARWLHLAAREKRKLSLITREATVVGSVAQLRYLERLKAALKAKKRSILQTEKNTKLKVKEGRAPESALFVLQSHIDDLDVSLNAIDQNVNTILSRIESLTGIRLKRSVPLRKRGYIREGEIFALKPLDAKVKASEKALEAADEAYMPTVVLKGNFTYSQGDAYNNGDRLHEHFGSAGVYLSMPLFDHGKTTASQEARVAYMQEKATYAKTAHALRVQASRLKREIALLSRSHALAKRSVANRKKLLEIAKVSFANGRITEEEYLRYEDALANAKAQVAKIEAQKWQDIAQLAVIYGNDLKGIVK